MHQFKPGDEIDGFKVRYQISSSNDRASYAVEDSGGKRGFMKICDISCFKSAYLLGDTLVHFVNMRSVMGYIADGVITISGVRYAYLVTEFIPGMTVSSFMKSKSGHDSAFVCNIMANIVLMLEYQSACRTYQYNNDICPANVMVWDDENGHTQARLINYDHAFCNEGDYPFRTDDLDPEYCATEVLEGRFTKSSDVFSICALYYRMIAGKHPWDYGILPSDSHETKVSKVLTARASQDMDLEPFELRSYDDVSLIIAGLSQDPSDRPVLATLFRAFSNTSWSSDSECDFQPEEPQDDLWFDEDAIFEDEYEDTEEIEEAVETEQTEPKLPDSDSKPGFAGVAGMDALKQDLTNRIIWVLKDKEKAERYGITPPCGMLLYGPPGCGKTFFAEKFAEETGFNFMMVRGSEISSSIVHGTQEKIGELFNKAREKTPTIICFDEFDAFVPSRNSPATEKRRDEVNEFLSQLNNCYEKGIFVIGTTNMKELIDPAILRKGRIELHVEIPAPDQEAREAMFELHLQDRPLSADIDIQELAKLTDNYSASDIAYIVNDAALAAAIADVEICQQHLVEAIKNNPSSLVSPESKRRRIGF